MGGKQEGGGRGWSQTFSKVGDTLVHVASAITCAELALPVRAVGALCAGRCWGEGETMTSAMCPGCNPAQPPCEDWSNS